jgi:2-methylcitrate dehydratase PrpD
VTQQAVVQAIQELKQKHPIDPQAITRVVIRGDPHIMDERHAVREPETVMGSQYSLPFTTAVALTRDLSNPLVYNDEAVRDPLVRDLAKRIELIPIEAPVHAEPGVYPAEVLLECDGQRYSIPTRPHKGSPRNPFTWDEICQKFRRFTASIISAKQADGIIAAVGQLEQVSDMAEVARTAAMP